MTTFPFLLEDDEDELATQEEELIRQAATESCENEMVEEDENKVREAVDSGAAKKRLVKDLANETIMQGMDPEVLWPRRF